MSPASTRADAVRNRQAILDAAQKVLISEGLSLQVTHVAELAGVGVATIYRNFTDRDTLITAVLSNMADELLELVQVSASADDPLDALTAAIGAMIERLSQQRALTDLATRWRNHYPDSPSLVNLQQQLGKLLKAAQKAGQVRKGIDAEDLRVLIVAASLADRGRPARQRLLDVIVAGIRS
jgi:AcrR family transcriptional regulator